MKIKKLVFQNINSLYGKWEIDFDCEKFRSGGIFAVTGKTGSGKSTILDAMCLALYGTTPRLSRDTAEAVSRGCHECMSELTFLDSNNREWTATFAYEMFQRGENKGKMKKEPMHRLSCNGKTEADKTTKVKAMVEEIIGLDFTRFCRAILLAQGSFDAFLSAGRDNGEILERITGTEIYSRIAEKVKARYNSEQSKLSAIEAAFSGISIMSDDEAAAMLAQVAVLDEEIVRYTGEQKELNQQMQKFELLDLHQKNLEKCIAGEQLLSDDETAFSVSRKRLEDGKKVLKADEKYRPLKELTEQHGLAEKTLQQNEQLLKEQSEIAARKAELKDTASASAAQFQKEFETLSGILTEVRKLDTMIAALKTSAASAEEKRNAEVRAAWDCRRRLAGVRQDLEKLTGEHSKATAYLEAHANDGELAAVRELCRERLENFKSASGELAGNAGKAAVCRKELDELQKAVSAQESLLEKELAKYGEISAAAAKAEEELARCLDGAGKEHWQTLCEKQEQCLHQAELLRSLEDHRKQLADGVACPLCGSLEHPFAMQNMPEPEKEYGELKKLKERLEKISGAENALQKITAGLAVCVNTRQQHENNLEQLKLRAGVKVQEMDTLRQAEERIRKDIELFSEKISSALAPFGLKWDAKSQTLPLELDSRIQEFEACKASQGVFEQKSKAYQDEILRLRTLLETQLSSCRIIRKEWINESRSVAAKQQERFALFGSKDPAAEEAEAEKKRKALTAELEKAQCEFTEISTRRSHTAEEIRKLQEYIAALLEQILHAREEFLFACTEAGVSEEEFRSCVLSQSQMTELAARDAELKTRREQLAAERQNCENGIREVTAVLDQQQNREEISAKLKEVSEALQEKNRSVGALREKLRQDAEANERMAEQRAKLNEQKKVMEVWNRLHDLIGSKDKFQRYAQGITLEHLLVLANLELEKFNGRYRLLRSRDEELGIDVADKDQGDEIRNCKTLSGGERFLVSLALALGLSQMAGEKIKIDSLFLDEGFGTLDAETLEIALGALSNLRNRGKLVGVISHVAAFSEKIPCIIEVHKAGGGRSTLRGPGVRSL